MSNPPSSAIFRPGLFYPALQVPDKARLFATLSDALVEQGVAFHRDALLRALLERERVGSTGIGLGAAVPHARSLFLAASVVAFARLREGIEFGAEDAAPVRLILLVVAPYGVAGALYFPLLSVVTRVLHDESVRHRLYEVETFADFNDLMKRIVTPRLEEVLAR